MIRRKEQKPEGNLSFGRRKFSKIALLNALCSGTILSNAGCSGKNEQDISANSPEKKDTSDINLSVISNPSASDEELLFYKQLGLDHLELFVKGDQDKYENLAQIKKRFEKAGFKINGIYNGNYYHGEEGDIHRLGLPGRDRKIESFKVLMQDMGKAGIHRYHMMGWHSTKIGEGGAYGSFGTTRNCTSLCFDYEKALKVPLLAKEYYGRVFSDDDMWENFTYFINRVIPAAEDNGVKIGMHPNYAIEKIGGVAFIFRSWDSYSKAFEIVKSENFGILFCVGSWATGGGENGIFGDAVEAIRHFGQQKRIFHVHFRNIAAPVPEPCIETFPDNGYVNMYEVMKALKETGYRGSVVPDHIPNFINSAAGNGVGRAYVIAYMRALLQTLDNESGQV